MSVKVDVAVNSLLDSPTTSPKLSLARVARGSDTVAESTATDSVRTSVSLSVAAPIASRLIRQKRYVVKI